MQTHSSSESLPDDMPELPGAWRRRPANRPLAAVASPHSVQSDVMDRPYGRPQLAQVGLGLSCNPLPNPFVRELNVVKQRRRYQS